MGDNGWLRRRGRGKEGATWGLRISPKRKLAGESERYAHAVEELKQVYGFDFVSIGLTAFIGAPLKWIYSAGATGERYRRIVLAPGHGIGGIVIKAGKPMMLVDIDAQIDPREYSSYPIVFAEDLHSFCALPLAKGGRVVGALLCAFRTVSDGHESVYMSLVRGLDGRRATSTWCRATSSTSGTSPAQGRSERGDGADSGKSQAVARHRRRRRHERKRISRELHDGIAQEMLGVSFLLNRLEPYLARRAEARCASGRGEQENMDRILDDLHNLSVELRPSALDHLGFMPALRCAGRRVRADLRRRIDFDGSLSVDRFDRALETQAYRICQEAILNACKYSVVGHHHGDVRGSGRLAARERGRRRLRLRRRASPDQGAAAAGFPA